jgi:hypothetical protein
MKLWIAYAQNKWKQNWDVSVGAHDSYDAWEGLSSLLQEEEMESEEDTNFSAAEWEIKVEEKSVDLKEGEVEMLEIDGYVVL